MRRNVADDEGVRVQAELCATCIFRPGNLMQLDEGRVAGMVAEATADMAGNIPCHETTYGQARQQAVCRGFWLRHRTPLLQVAERMGVVEYVPSPSAPPTPPPR